MAVPVADAVLRAALARPRAALSGARDLRWVHGEQLHLTLRFFADLPPERAEAVAAASAAGAAAAPFDLEVRGLGRFPAHGPLRVVWAGLGAGREPLVALAGSLARELEARGFPAEERPFAPHLTLARARDPRGSKENARAVAAFAPSVGAFGTQRVDGLVLFRSDLGAGLPFTRRSDGSRSGLRAPPRMGLTRGDPMKENERHIKGEADEVAQRREVLPHALLEDATSGRPPTTARTGSARRISTTSSPPDTSSWPCRRSSGGRD